MSRLIDADKLRKDIQFVLDTLGEPTRYGLRQAMSIIDRTPTVDMDTTNCDMTAETLAKILEKINEIDEKYQISATYNVFHGHWIKGSKSDEEVGICSFCGCGFYDINENYHFCPHCGVLMDEEVEEQN